MVKRKADWTPTMEQRADLEGPQVKCLIASGGAPLDAGLFRPISVSRATPTCRKRFQHLSGVHGRRSSHGSPSTQRNQTLCQHQFPRGRAALERAARRRLGVLMVPTPRSNSDVNGPTIDRISRDIAAENSPATSVASFQQDGRDIEQEVKMTKPRIVGADSDQNPDPAAEPASETVETSKKTPACRRRRSSSSTTKRKNSAHCDATFPA